MKKIINKINTLYSVFYLHKLTFIWHFVIAMILLISRKGNEFDLIENPEYREKALKILSSLDEQNINEAILMNVAKSIIEHPSFESSIIDSSVLKELIIKVDIGTAEIIKEIKDELPLIGLLNRIENLYNIIGLEKILNKNSRLKKLKTTLNKWKKTQV